MEFVRIPPGEFEMGCSPVDLYCEWDEDPHFVRITKGFEMGKYEVTSAQWEAVMGTNPSNFSGPNRPVEQITWNQVQEFLAKLTAQNDGYRYRLPTEAEWEYAARAGSKESYFAPVDEIAWYEVNAGDQDHPVGLKKPNAWGLHDMQGNVFEWVQDWYSDTYYRNSPENDPQGPATGEARVVRGGAWDVSRNSQRVSYRASFEPDYFIHVIGFRCVREPVVKLPPK